MSSRLSSKTSDILDPYHADMTELFQCLMNIGNEQSRKDKICDLKKNVLNKPNLYRLVWDILEGKSILSGL